VAIQIVAIQIVAIEFITLFQAATKSFTKASFESSQA